MSDLLLICHDDGIHMHCAKQASRSDVLEWLGWEKCRDCYGTGDKAEFRGPMGYEGLMPVKCNPLCLSGLVPPVSQIEAAAEAIALVWFGVAPSEKENQELDKDAARAALIAAMGEGVGDE